MIKLPDGRVLYMTDYVQRTKAKHRRASRKAARVCINGESHGPATHGVLCESCRKTHRGSS